MPRHKLHATRHPLIPCPAGDAQRAGGSHLFAANPRPSTLDARLCLHCQKRLKIHKKVERLDSSVGQHQLVLTAPPATLYSLPSDHLDQALFHLVAPEKDHQPKPDTRTIIFFSAANSSKSNVKPDLLKRI